MSPSQAYTELNANLTLFICRDGSHAGLLVKVLRWSETMAAQTDDGKPSAPPRPKP
jgi:hypothetical protein